MKALLLFLFLPLSFSSHLFAQHSLTRKNNAPRPGDEIVKQQVEYKDPGRAGENVLWDFSSLYPINEEYKLNYLAPYLINDSIYIMGKDTVQASTLGSTSLVVGEEHFTRYYYAIRDSGMYHFGHTNPVSRMSYAPSVPQLPFGTNPDEKQQRNYTAETRYSGTEKMYVEGTVTAEIDACGILLLPDNDTLRHAIRVRTVNVLHENADSLASSYREIPDSLRADFERVPVKTITETCRWYEQGYRYPVFETVRMLDKSKGEDAEYFTTAFFYPPQDHYYLEDDPENLAVLDSLQNETEPSSWIERNFRYNIYPNPVVNTLYIEYYLEEPADVKVTLANSLSLPMQIIGTKQREAGTYSEIIDCTALVQGSYVLRFDVKGEFVSEIILKR